MTDYLTARDRPLGIVILSILHLIGGVGLVIGFVALTWLRADPEAIEGLRAMGLPLPLILAGVGFLAVLGIASAVGMWKGRAWGWYLGSFWYAYAIVRNLNALITVYRASDVLPAEELASADRGPGYYYAKFGIRVIVSALIFLYFFKTNVREYFGLETIRFWKVAAAELALCVLIAIAVTAAAQFM